MSVDGGEFTKSEIVEVLAKTIKNPRTQKNITIPAHKSVKLKISKKFKNMKDVK